ncbi:MAG: alpha-hydroxy-acid oxidizing protein [Clostridia bacterium]|nr:alpha-hydroxy-acid oxidizing protein [Clostridia bacterium]
MEYGEILENAKKTIGELCYCCPVCNGLACGNTIPGPGSKAPGNGANRNWKAWQEIYVNMDTIAPDTSVDTSLQLFGQKFRYPFFAAPVGSLKINYQAGKDMREYNDIMIESCVEAGITALFGDGLEADITTSAMEQSSKMNGLAIPTINPWNMDKIFEEIDMANEAKCFALAFVIDSAGLPFLKKYSPDAGSKTVPQLKEMIARANMPVIIKGIMTVKGAEKALEAGASAIFVSNHGGRVIAGSASTAEVLPEIVKAVDGRAKIFVDGGIRSGLDVFRALALGADAALICRPFVVAYHGGAREGIQSYIEKIGSELQDTMYMCGARSLADIAPDMLRFAK